MKLAMSELRMGHCNFNTETDSYWTRWYHLQCAKVKDSVDTSEIEGYEDLTAEEQDTVKNNVFPSRRAAKKETRLAELRERKRKRGSGGGGGGGSPSSKAKVSASSAAAAAIPTVATVVLTPSLATTTTTTMTASSTSLATALAAAQAMLVRELKSELKQRSLSTSGKKALLLATLSAALVTELGDAKLTEAIAEAKSLRVVDLKAALAEYGLKGMKGKKAVLLAALIEAITEEHIGAVAESESESESEEEESEEEESEEEESEEESESDEAAGTSDDVDLTNAEESELALLENENKYSSMKVRELKDLLRQNNQLLGGNKPELGTYSTPFISISYFPPSPDDSLTPASSLPPSPFLQPPAALTLRSTARSRTAPNALTTNRRRGRAASPCATADGRASSTPAEIMATAAKALGNAVDGLMSNVAFLCAARSPRRMSTACRGSRSCEGRADEEREQRVEAYERRYLLL